jgi:transcriptional regulator with XRE-family HTH domain
MAQPRRGRPPNPVDADASHSAKLGAKLRAMRTDASLTLAQLGGLAGFTPQYISEVERAKTAATPAFIAAVELALNAHSALESLLPAAMREHDAARRERGAARRAARTDPPLRCEAHSDAGEDLEPTNRRGLIGAGAAAALGAATVGPVPARACEVDPELPRHWADLLALLGRHAEMFGSRGVFGIVQREIRLIDQHRRAARGDLRTELVRVEARWSGLAAWLCHHTGDGRGRDAWTDRALWLAHESDYSDMSAFGRGRQSKHASDARRAAEYAEDGLRVRGASAQTRAWCARYAAVGHAKVGDTAACERRLHDAYSLLADPDSSAPPWAHGFRVTYAGTRATEARCWLVMAPAKAIPLYEDALCDWPRAEVQHGGLQRARLALACAKAGELDRAEAEGAKALVIAKRTGSATIKRELRQLGAVLNA